MQTTETGKLASVWKNKATESVEGRQKRLANQRQYEKEKKNAIESAECRQKRLQAHQEYRKKYFLWLKSKISRLLFVEVHCTFCSCV